jgi:hypothetical protein
MTTWDTSEWEARECAAQLGRFALKLPEPAAEALHRLTKLQANRPQQPPHNGVAEMLADAADAAVIDAAVADVVEFKHRNQQHLQAEQILGRRVLASVLEHRGTLHRELAHVAEPLIERLHRAASIDESIAELVKQNRMDDARLLSGIEADAAELMACFKFRDVYLTPPGAQWSTGIWSCQHFENPWDVGHIGTAIGGDLSLWGDWRAAIQAGAKLWFASIEEATAASSAHEPVDEPEPIDPANIVRWR